MKKFALIGCGRISERHAENIARLGKLVAVCDVIEDRAAKMAAKYDCRSYTSLDDLLAAEKEIEVISVCTPNGFHAEHVIKSLQASKHVLCEKPLCLTTAAAWQIIETEKYCRRKLFVVKSTRYNPLLQRLQAALASNELGVVYSFALSCIWNRPTEYYTDWRGKAFPDGGTLYTQFSHYIDALLWLLGPVADVKGFRTNAAHSDSIEFEDTGSVALKMQRGSTGTFHWTVNAFRKNHEISLTIVAEKGTIRLGGPYLDRVEFEETETPINFPQPQNGANDYKFYKGSMSNHDEVYNHLLRVLDNDDRSFTGAFEGLATVETIEKIYKAVGEPFATPH